MYNSIYNIYEPVGAPTVSVAIYVLENNSLYILCSLYYSMTQQPQYIKTKVELLNQYFRNEQYDLVRQQAESIMLDIEEWETEAKLDAELTQHPEV